jgi:lysophospholipase L1-like esterase
MISRTGPQLAALLTTMLLVASGCGDDTSSDATSGSSDSPSAGSSSSAPATDGPSYVALGDSYTAAPLVPVTETGDPCLRSSNNYPHLVAASLPDYTLTDVSCSGADSAAMIGVQQIGSALNPPQFDSLKPDTDLVTVGLGGNDFGLFSSILADCASSSDVNAEGSPCTAAAASGSKQDLQAVLPKVAARLTAVIAGVKDRSPQARILVVGYPQLLPPTGTCAELPIPVAGYDYVRSLIKGLDAAVRTAATNDSAEFIDIYTASAGHDMCSSDPWINGPVTDPQAALAFHPFEAEQVAVADLIKQALAAPS